MKQLPRLVTILTAALALTTPAPAQAGPGINANYSDWRVATDLGTCTSTRVPIIGFPPDTVTVSKTDISAGITCTSGWALVNQDLIIDFHATNATVRVVDVTVGIYFFWCRYVATNVPLYPTGSADYSGSVQTLLNDSNYPSQCPNPVQYEVSVGFYQA